ncbi:hypothetical protein DCAR_0521981 [Daucus carota subsp. sativus]|uniref:Uncharacterized protein n=1 Tax=Daucus carota subsp. sativus TaxID=79200 RepID=A0A162A464_DAUCS|nr:hypothetical protein DCAR_0521981 [Daucus carota subsp. sativus]
MKLGKLNKERPKRQEVGGNFDIKCSWTSKLKRTSERYYCPDSAILHCQFAMVFTQMHGLTCNS